MLAMLALGCNQVTESASGNASLPVSTVSQQSASGLKIVKLEESDDLKRLSKMVKEASGDRTKVLILYFTASWCPPCRFFDRSLENPSLQLVMENVVMFKIDVDHTPEEIADHFEVSSYPTYLKVNGELEELGMIDGGDWGEDVFENLLPVMNAFVNTSEYDYPMEK